MADDHLRYERLAVGHVVGGLDEVDAASFRAHLLDCRDCRRRVGELRDIASSLAATEREERAAARTRTEVTTRAPEVDEEPVERDRSWRSWAWGAVAVTAALVLVLSGLAWGVWLRAEKDLLDRVVTTQDEVLAVMAVGRELPWTGSASVTGTVVTDGTRVAVNLAGVPTLRADEGVLVWLLDEDGGVVDSSDPWLPSRTVSGRLTVLHDLLAGAASLVVTVEADPFSAVEPAGDLLLEADLEVAPAAGP